MCRILLNKFFINNEPRLNENITSDANKKFQDYLTNKPIC